MLRRLLPSPAMVVAMIALFVSLGGVSYGLATGVIDSREIRDNTIRSRDVRNGILTGRDMGRDRVGGGAVKESTLGTVPGASVADGTARFASVTADGVLARGRSVTSAARTSPGRYQVIFDRDVRNCVFQATIADAGAAAPPQGEIGASALSSNVNGVAVRTENSAGNPADRPFHLIVPC
jgi:hypothetical protein